MLALTASLKLPLATWPGLPRSEFSATTRVCWLPVTVETAKGQERSGAAPDGTRWSVKLPADYGYVKRTRGADGDRYYTDDHYDSFRQIIEGD